MGELAECFQWKGEVRQGLPEFSEEERAHVAGEMVAWKLVWNRWSCWALWQTNSQNSQHFRLVTKAVGIHTCIHRHNNYQDLIDKLVLVAAVANTHTLRMHTNCRGAK